MIYQVNLNYHRYNFTNKYEAMDFAEMAYKSGDPVIVEITIMDEKEAHNG